MKRLLILSASLALSSPALAQAPIYSWELPDYSGKAGIQQPDQTKTGRRFEWVPVPPSEGIVIGPVKPDAYGLGVGMDATGKPVRAREKK